MKRRLVTATALALLLGLGAGAAPSAAMFTGVETVTQRSAETSAAKSVTATCPAGKRVMGAGADTTGANGRLLLTAVRPSPGLTSVTATAAEGEGGTASAWSVAAYAICAPAPAGLERIAAATASSSAAKRVTATCPAGKKVLGTGAELTGAAGQVVLDGLVPSADLQTVAVNAFEDETGTASGWTATAYAICGSPAQGVSRVAATSATDSEPVKGAFAPCPAGKVPVGFGGEIDSGGGQVVIDAAFPAFTAQGPGFAAAEDATGYTGSWSTTAYTICGASATVISDASTSFGDAVETRTTTCPTGRSLTAMGTGIEGGRGSVWLRDLTIEGAPPAGATVSWATETSTAAGLTRHAICASGLTASEWVGGSAQAGPEDPVKTGAVQCPPGTRVLGGGAAPGPGTGNHTMIQALLPVADLTALSFRIAETEAGVPGAWMASGQAICAPPPPGLVRVSRTAPASDSSELKTAVARCPAGKHVLGLGAAISPGIGQAIVDDVRPDHALTSVTVEAIEDRTGYETDWTVTAYAVCVDR